MPDVELHVVPDPPWIRQLQSNKAGFPYPTVANALIILAHDPKFENMLGYNAFTGRRVLLRAPPPATTRDFTMPGPYPRTWRNEDISLILAYMQRVWSDKFSHRTISDAVEVAALEYAFHPVRDWINELVWDKTPRLDNWLINAFDPVYPTLTNEEWKRRHSYYQMVGACFMIAAIRRVRCPGCKFDSMLILEGPQRIGKSTAFLTLFGRDWFSDSVPPDLRNRDAAIALHGLWCLEFAEIEHLVRTEIETIKAFLSRAIDHYRPVHGMDFVDMPRQVVLVGTTNSDDYLRDPTGNSRMWPVLCRSADIEWIALNRDQLWAEAAYREAAGEAIWLDNKDAQAEAAETTNDRMSNEVWEPAIIKWLTDPETNMALPLTSARVLEMALGMSKDKMTKASEMRVAIVLRGLGYQRVVVKDGKRSMRVWRMSDEVVEEVSTTDDREILF